jgi:hypothetical protein
MASSDSRRIGVALTAGGVALLILGVLLLFDRALLALGNVRLALPSFCGTLERSSEPRVSVFSSYAIFLVDALPRGRCSVRWPNGRNAFLRQASKRPRALLSLCILSGNIFLSSNVPKWILPTHAQGSVCFFLGFAVVLIGYAIVGMLIESYGFFALFRRAVPCLHLSILLSPAQRNLHIMCSNFLPTAVSVLQNVPGVGAILKASPIKQVRSFTFVVSTQPVMLAQPSLSSFCHKCCR